MLLHGEGFLHWPMLAGKLQGALSSMVPKREKDDTLFPERVGTKKGVYDATW
jgi:hypothetical protein